MTLFVESMDVDAAWEVYYQLADRRNQPGLTRKEFESVFAGVLEVMGAKRVESTLLRSLWSHDVIRGIPVEVGGSYLLIPLVSPWVEVEEHQ